MYLILIPKRILFTIAMAFLLGVFQLAQAESQATDEGQETGKTPPAPESQLGSNEDDELVLEEVIATGTRLQSAPASSPLIIMDKAEIDARGLKTVEDILRFIPQNSSDKLSGSTFDSGVIPNQGDVTVNLRGLGEGATLVLVNGKRISSTPVAFMEAYTDISTIPFAAIERVEVMADGGSAMYGSDAVAGVINFILKKDYQGGETRLRHENSSSGGDRLSFEQNLGLNWENGNLTASFSYTKQDAVWAKDAGLNLTGDFREEGGRLFPVVLYGQPGLLRGRYPVGAPGGNFAALLPPGDGTNIAPEDIIYVSFGDFLSRSGNYLLLPAWPSSFATAVPESKDTSAYLSLTQDFGENWSFNVNGIFAKGEVESQLSNNFIRTVIPTSNYYNAINNFGQEVQVGYEFNNEVAAGLIDPRGYSTESSRWNLFASLDWDMPLGDWKANLSLSAGEDKDSGQVRTNEINLSNPAVIEAINSGDPAIALNLFGDGTVQRSNLNDLLTDDALGSSFGKQKVASLGFTGSLFELPGGRVEMAFGGEMRTDTLEFSDRLGFLLNDGTPITPESDNTAWYVEFAVPIVGASNAIPGIHKLGLQLAGRYDDYKIEGPFEGAGLPESTRSFDDFVPKIGMAWHLNESFKVRASWSEAFQAPRLISLFGPSVAFPGFAFDPLNPESNGGPGVPVFPTVQFGGNPNLIPQNSETTTFGFDYTPGGAMQGLRLSATWVQSDFENIISTLGDSGLSDAFILSNWEEWPDLIERDADGVLITYGQFVEGNLERRVNEALDLEVAYMFGTGIGDFTIGSFATRNLAYDIYPVANADAINNAGTEFASPDWKFNLYADWLRGNWSANATVNYTDGWDLVADEFAIQDSVGSYTIFNLQVNYAMPESGWRFSAGVQNLFDADFPFVDDSRGASSRQVDYRRRVIFLSLIKDFDW